MGGGNKEKKNFFLKLEKNFLRLPFIRGSKDVKVGSAIEVKGVLSQYSLFHMEREIASSERLSKSDMSTISADLAQWLLISAVLRQFSETE